MATRRAELQAAFRPVISSEALPPLDAFLSLGRALQRSRLVHFVDTTHFDRSIGGQYACPLLYAATRIHDPGMTPEELARVDDRGHIQKLMGWIAEKDCWGHVRDAITKFAKKADAELEAYEPPEPAGSGQDSPKLRGRYPERDAEVIRLKEEKPERTAGQIAKLVCANPKWATLESGRPFNARTVRAILSRARKAKHLDS